MTPSDLAVKIQFQYGFGVRAEIVTGGRDDEVTGASGDDIVRTGGGDDILNASVELTSTTRVPAMTSLTFGMATRILAFKRDTSGGAVMITSACMAAP